jgi:hypothetical protein
MAENDGNTLPATEPFAPVRPLQITPSELMPVTPGVFEVIHKLNIRFERLLQDFQTLQRIPYFPHTKLTAWQNTLGLIQAEANLSLIEPIKDRERKNALYFDRLCAQREREIKDPTMFSLRLNTANKNWPTNKRRRPERPKNRQLRTAFASPRHPEFRVPFLILFRFALFSE